MRHPVDLYVGSRLRLRRDLVGMTQKQLAEQVGVKFQQIQKYEAGNNRISASRMWDIAGVLGVPVSFFFDGMEGQWPDTGEETGFVADNSAIELVRVYRGIPKMQRQKFLDLARMLCQAA